MRKILEKKVLHVGRYWEIRAQMYEGDKLWSVLYVIVTILQYIHFAMVSQ